MQTKVILEFQHFHGCPNGPKLLKNIKEAIQGLDNVELIERIVDTNEKAKKYQFRGSPTLLINGKDLEGLEAPTNPSLTCRFYPKGLPTAEEIRERIRAFKE
ncbi:MAG: thioredoxin family protein [Candidatus Kapabacteria bacterium]|nr:thioredoxin family protein [Candidatus Kapabacteria bacterium]